jgi:molybdenum cofactor cytidylyltransferase
MNSEKSICEHIFTEKLTLNACCVIAAAGLSSRMGLWKGDLQLATADFHGREKISLIEKAVKTALESCRKVILVGGEQMPRIKVIFASCEELILVENREYEKGMLSSIQAAMSFVDSDFFIMPMDMPLLTSNHLHRIHREFSIHTQTGIFRPVYKKQAGHPVLLPYSWKERILSMKGSSLKVNLSDEDQILIPWENESVVLDLDTQEAYEGFLKDYSNSSD